MSKVLAKGLQQAMESPKGKHFWITDEGKFKVDALGLGVALEDTKIMTVWARATVEEEITPFMKNVQIVFNVQIPDHVSEQEVSVRLRQVIGSLMAQEFGVGGNPQDQSALLLDEQEGQVGHA